MENLNSKNLTQRERSELFGQLIDVVEDWLEEKGITPEMIPNEEREDEDENSAIIYGTDYDYLADKFSTVLGISRYEENVMLQNNIDEDEPKGCTAYNK